MEAHESVDHSSGSVRHSAVADLEDFGESTGARQHARKEEDDIEGTADRSDTDDIFDDAVLAETYAIQSGREEGLARGRQLGHIEGRELGHIKGAEIGGEIGFYAGAVTALAALVAKYPPERLSTRVPRILEQLQELLSGFPVTV